MNGETKRKIRRKVKAKNRKGFFRTILKPFASFRDFLIPCGTPRENLKWLVSGFWLTDGEISVSPRSNGYLSSKFGNMAFSTTPVEGKFDVTITFSGLGGDPGENLYVELRPDPFTKGQWVKLEYGESTLRATVKGVATGRYSIVINEKQVRWRRRRR